MLIENIKIFKIQLLLLIKISPKSHLSKAQRISISKSIYDFCTVITSTNTHI